MRNNIPDSAFAYVGDVGGVEYKLLRHHIGSETNGNDHDSVDLGLLKLACNVVDQLPVSDSEKDNVRVHLYQHAVAVKLDLKDIWSEETKRRIANLSNPSQADEPITNEDLNRTEVELVDDNVATSPSLPKGQEPSMDRPSDTRAEVIHKDDEDKSVPSDQMREPGISDDPGNQKDPNAVVKNEHEVEYKPDDTLVGAPVSVVKVGDRFGVALVDEHKVVTAKFADGTEQKLESGEYIVLATFDVDPKLPANIPVVGNVPELKSESDKIVEPDSIHITQENVTERGKETFMGLLRAALEGKTNCEYIGTEKYGSIDYVTVKVGDEEFPFHIILDIARDPDGNAVGIKMWNESLPADVLSDFADFLKKLVKGKE